MGRMEVTVDNRIILSPQDAYDIYKLKIEMMSKGSTFSSVLSCSKQNLRGKSRAIAIKYKVSSKSIRDIWNRKTWVNATGCLWDQDPDESFINARVEKVNFNLINSNND